MHSHKKNVKCCRIDVPVPPDYLKCSDTDSFLTLFPRRGIPQPRVSAVVRLGRQKREPQAARQNAPLGGAGPHDQVSPYQYYCSGLQLISQYQRVAHYALELPLGRELYPR